MTERRHPASQPIPDAKDHQGWIDLWHRELMHGINDHVANGSIIALEHAERSARMLHWHATKWKPALKPPRDY